MKWLGFGSSHRQTMGDEGSENWGFPKARYWWVTPLGSA